MTKADIGLGIELIKYTFEKLPVRARIKVVEELGRATRKERWNEVVSVIRARVRARQISQREIDRICEDVRTKLYETKSKSGS